MGGPPAHPPCASSQCRPAQPATDPQLQPPTQPPALPPFPLARQAASCSGAHCLVCTLTPTVPRTGNACRFFPALGAPASCRAGPSLCCRCACSLLPPPILLFAYHLHSMLVVSAAASRQVVVVVWVLKTCGFGARLQSWSTTVQGAWQSSGAGRHRRAWSGSVGVVRRMGGYQNWNAYGQRHVGRRR